MEKTSTDLLYEEKLKWARNLNLRIYSNFIVTFFQMKEVNLEGILDFKR